jgi:glycine betaine/proline transport system ATP-binding protein
MSENTTKKSVKLSCRNVWKVYGGRPKSYFTSRSGPIGSDTPELVKKIRADGGIPAAANVSFDVHEGEIFVIMGLSGSGKSTMVRCLSRLVEPTHGEILKWSQKTGHRAKVYPEPLKGYDDGKAPELYRSV